MSGLAQQAPRSGWPAAAGKRAAAAASRIAALAGWRRRLAAFLTGALSVLAMAPFFLWPVLAATLPVLVWLIDGACAGPRPVRDAALDGWWLGFGYHFAGLFWVGEAFLVEAEVFGRLLPFAVTLLPAGLALFFGAAAAAAGRIASAGPGRVVALALALAVAEWLRGHVLTGFPWNVLGYALTGSPALMQSAALAGVYALTLPAVAVLAWPLVAIAERGRLCDGRRWAVAVAPAALLLALLWTYGSLRLAAPPPPAVAGVKLRLVQPAIAQRDKWRAPLQRAIFETHLSLSLAGPDGRPDDLAGITHVVWPEAAMPFRPLETPEALERIGAALPDHVHLVSGALRSEWVPADPPVRRHYNSLVVLSGTGQPVASYDKTHLVPFGEYLPMQRLLEAIGLQQLTRLRGGFSTGPVPRPLLAVPGLPPAGALICYEAIFPAAIVQGAARPGVLVNVTNDGWFGRTTGPHQHFHQARVRAVEEGVPLVRVANNGISAVIDAHGRVLQRLGLDVRGVIDTALPGTIAPPPYARWGDAGFAVLAAIFALALWVLPGRSP